MWGSGTKAGSGIRDDFRIEVEDGRARVYVPFRREFVYGIRELGIGARWNGSAWSVPEGSIDAVRALMEEFFGRTDLPDDSRIVTVRVTVMEELSEEHGPICLFGRVVASAGAREGRKRGLFYQRVPEIGRQPAVLEDADPRGGGIRRRRHP